MKNLFKIIIIIGTSTITTSANAYSVNKSEGYHQSFSFNGKIAYQYKFLNYKDCQVDTFSISKKGSIIGHALSSNIIDTLTCWKDFGTKANYSAVANAVNSIRSK